MKALTACPPRTLLRLSRLLRIGAIVAAALAFRLIFAHRASPAIGVGFGFWVVLEIGASRLRKLAGDGSRQQEGN